MPFLVPFFVALGAKIAAAKIAIIISVATSVGTAVLSRLLRPRRRIEALDGAKSTIRSEIVPARWVLGEGVRTPGALVYFGSAGREARMGLVLGEGECERIADQVWIDGQAVPLIRTADAAGDQLKPQAASKYADKIEIREYFAADGTQGTHMRIAAPAQTYDYDQGDGTYGSFPNYGTEFQRPQGQQPEPYVTPFPVWDATHKLNGLSWVYVRLTQPEYGQDIDKRFWTRVPNLEFLVDGLKITWPSQAVPTTTSNAAAVRHWWETERRGRLASAIDTASFAAAFALSNEDVDATNGGADPLPAGYSGWPTTSKRYAIRGVFASGDDIGGVEDRLDVAWAGEVVESAGSLYFRPGVDRAALLSIDDAQIIEPPVARPWPALQERVNALTGEIPQSAQHDWSSLSLPQVPETVAPAALERAGGKRSGHVRLAYLSDPLSAGRLLAVNLRRGRESLRIQLVVTPGETFEFTGLIPTDRVLLTNSEYGLVQSRFEVERVLIRQNGAVALTLREDLVGTYDDTLVLPPLEPRVIRLEDNRQVPDVSRLISDELAETGSDGVTAIHLLISWDAVDARETEVNIRRKLGTPDWESIISVGSNLRLPGVVAGETYQIRARHWNRRGVAGEWSPTREDIIDGDLTPPGQMTSFDLSPLPGGYRATWTNPADEDYAAARVYASGSNSFATAVSVAEVSADYYVETGLPAATTVFVWVRALDAAGNAGQVRGPLDVEPTLGAGTGVYDIGSAAVPDPNLGVAGDTAINDAGDYFLRTTTGWVLRGDLTPDPGSEVYFYGSGEALMVFPPPATFGADGDIAIGPNGRVLRKVAGAWVDVELIIPAPIGLSAAITIVNLDPLNVGATIYDLNVGWTQEAGDYLAEVDIGLIPTVDITNLTGATWGDLDGVSSTNFHHFSTIREATVAGKAVRVRFIGSFGQRGAWTYALYSSDAALAIEYLRSDRTEIQRGDTITISWAMRNADSATLNGVAIGDLSSGNVQRVPTVTTTYTLIAVKGSDTVTATVTVNVAGTNVFDIGSDTVPDPTLGQPGDTAINDGGEYFLKTDTGWVLRGDLTVDPGSEVYFFGTGEALTVFPPGSAFGVDGDIAIGPNGRVLRKVSGAWVDVELVIPAPTGLTAILTLVSLTPAIFVNSTDALFTLDVEWAQPARGHYLAEIDLGIIPSEDIADLTGATWGDLDGISATNIHHFATISLPAIVPNGKAARVRFIGSFGQRGPWTYAFYSSVNALAIDSFTADKTQIESGDTATLRWEMRNAESASIDQGVGALSASQLESGSTQVSPTATTTYRLTAIGGGDTVTKDVTVTVGMALAQPSITRFEPDDSTLSTTQTTTVRWTGVNGISGTITGPGLNRALTTAELTGGTQGIGPLSAGNHTYRLTLNGEAGTNPATRSFSVTVTTTPPDPDPVTIDSFTRNPTTIESGESSLLSWATSNADAVTLDGATVTADGSMSVSPTSNTTYTLRATGEGGPVTRSVTVTVTDPPPPPTDPEVVSFTASSLTIAQGSAVTLTWVTRNGDTTRLTSRRVGETDNDLNLDVAASGSRTDTPTATTTYRIATWLAADPAGTADFRDITVTVTVGAAVIDSFTVDDNTPDENENYTLSWTTTGATRVRLQEDFNGFSNFGGDRPADGSLEIGGHSNTRRWRIQAYNANDVITTSGTITVNPG